MTTPLIRSRLETVSFAATTAVEFLTLLRNIQQASGQTAGQIARSAKLPRSTCYSFVSPKNTRLPASGEKVERFARACMLNQIQIAQVMRIWRELAGIDQEQESADGDSTDEMPDYPVDATPLLPNISEIVTPEDRAFQERQRMAYALKMVASKSPSRSTSSEPAEAEVLIEALRRVLAVYHGRGGCVHTWARTYRYGVLVTMLLALYPMTVVMLGQSLQHPVVAVLFFAVSTLAVAVNVMPWLERPAANLSPPRLLAAAATGVGAGILTWAAVQAPVIGLISGLVVFTAAPMWFTTLSHQWSTLFTTGRGVFAVTVALWFGVLVGVLAVTTGGLGLPGAAMSGIVCGAAVLMEMAVRTHPGEAPPPRSTGSTVRPQPNGPGRSDATSPRLKAV